MSAPTKNDIDLRSTQRPVGRDSETRENILMYPNTMTVQLDLGLWWLFNQLEFHVKECTQFSFNTLGKKSYGNEFNVQFYKELDELRNN